MVRYNKRDNKKTYLGPNDTLRVVWAPFPLLLKITWLGSMLRSLFFFLSLDLILPILSVDLIRHRSSPFLNLTSYQTLILYSDLITQLPTCDYLAFALIPLRSHRHASTLRRTCIYLTFIAQSPTCDYLMLHMPWPCVRHAATMCHFTYIPVVHSLASYYLLKSLLLSPGSLARP